MKLVGSATLECNRAKAGGTRPFTEVKEHPRHTALSTSLSGEENAAQATLNLATICNVY